MKVAIVVQRYGADINGGAEQHARYIAEHLAPHVQVEVLTTCAHDYITWRNERPEGVETVNGVPVRRFPVSRERDPLEFGTWSAKVFGEAHSLRDELAWLEAEGPTSPALIDHIKGHAADFDFFIFFSLRYPHSFHGVRAVPGKAVIVPTAERDGAVGLGIYPPILRGARAFMYNSYEERAMLQAVSGNTDVPGVVVGVGSEIPERTNAARFRQKFDMRERFAIYVGRIDQNKGCAELFDFFEHYSAALVDGMHLVLIGNAVIPVPDHPRIHHLGFVDDQDKYDAMAASELLIMPSYLESLSMVALEAWALGKPVLANAKCDVLQGQCLRSNAGLFYDNFAEFFEALRAIDSSPSLQAALGRNGREFFEKHYAWPVVVKKYLDMLERLSKEQPSRKMEPLPGWFARRRRTQPPADEVVKRLPAGAWREKAEPARTERPRPQEPRPPRPEARPPRPEARPQRQDTRPQRPHDRPHDRPQDRQGRRPEGRPQGGRPQPPPQSQAPRNPQPSEPRAPREGQDRDPRGRDRRGRMRRRGRRPGNGGSGGGGR